MTFLCRKGVQVFNCASGSLNPLKWKDFRRYAMNACDNYPVKEVLWRPGCNYRLNTFVFKAEVYLYHYLPAHILDVLARISGRKPFLVSVSTLTI